jgi:hypothetical protein
MTKFIEDNDGDTSLQIDIIMTKFIEDICIAISLMV